MKDIIGLTLFLIGGIGLLSVLGYHIYQINVLAFVGYVFGGITIAGAAIYLK